MRLVNSLVAVIMIQFLAPCAHAWVVTREKGEMTDMPVVIACMDSENKVQVQLDSVEAKLCVRLINGRVDALVVNGYGAITNCFLNFDGRFAMTLRADDHLAERLQCTRSDDGGAHNVGFFNDTSRALEVIKSAQKVLRIEVPLSRLGSAVFRFKVSGKKLPRELR